MGPPRAHVRPVNPAFSDALPIATLILLVSLGVAGVLAGPWWVERRRARLHAVPFPAAWRRILRRRVPGVARLPADLQQRLKRHIQVFLAEKAFLGCQGQAITDEIRVTIAAQACLLLLGQRQSECFPQLRQILVYPDAFVVQRERALGGGVVREQRQVMAGESWAQGQVILAPTCCRARPTPPTAAMWCCTNSRTRSTRTRALPTASPGARGRGSADAGRR